MTRGPSGASSGAYLDEVPHDRIAWPESVVVDRTFAAPSTIEVLARRWTDAMAGER